jgi:DNA-directed RNA polymerase specialized sigma24 family protein
MSMPAGVVIAASYRNKFQHGSDTELEQSDDPDLWLYRERTIGLLKRYGRLSVEVGRLPSILGGEFFRAKVTSYHVATFEDVVIFVHDVERSLEKLDELERELIAKIVLEEYSQEEAARLLGCADRTVRRRFPEALDRLSEIFLRGRLLNRIPRNPRVENSCQEGESDQNCVNDCVHSE